ncbi:MAG: AraC family transcriptional regulator [Eubacterium sp.]|nr:AraC family transcriptional regulator [Eubacterium sp.]
MKSENEKYLNSINLYADTDFPYLVLDVINDRSYPLNPGFRVMHRHEDLQFIYVLSGSVEVKTLDNAVSIQKGEGIFINKNVVHYVRRMGECHYNSFIFPAQFIEFSVGHTCPVYSPAKQFVDSVVENKQFMFFHFTKEEEWQEKALLLLCRLYELEKEKTEFYVYEVLVLLAALWLTMRKNILIPPKQNRRGKLKNTVSMRMQKFLHHIEQHYPEDLTLEDIAESANVSKSECLRCFHLTLQTTPYKYLMEYRLSKAAELLKKTVLPVSDIETVSSFV